MIPPRQSAGFSATSDVETLAQTAGVADEISDFSGAQQQKAIDPVKKENIMRADRENAIILVTELLKNCHDLPGIRREGLQMLLRMAGDKAREKSRGARE